MAGLPTSPFFMHGAREAIAGGLSHIEEQVQAIERAIIENPGLAFDFAKTLVERVCKTVLSERGCVYEERWDLPRLFKETLDRLQLIPMATQETQGGSESLRKVVGGLQTTIQGICALRNSHGFASHGKDASFQQLEPVQALLVARSADAIVHFLFAVHKSYGKGVAKRRLTYEDHPAFNKYVDEENNPVRIFDLTYRPSEVLFHVDEQAYRDYLCSFEASDTDEADAEETVSQGEVCP